MEVDKDIDNSIQKHENQLKEQQEGQSVNYQRDNLEVAKASLEQGQSPPCQQSQILLSSTLAILPKDLIPMEVDGEVVKKLQNQVNNQEKNVDGVCLKGSDQVECSLEVDRQKPHEDSSPQIEQGTSNKSLLQYSKKQQNQVKNNTMVNSHNNSNKIDTQNVVEQDMQVIAQQSMQVQINQDTQPEKQPQNVCEEMQLEENQTEATENLAGPDNRQEGVSDQNILNPPQLLQTNDNYQQMTQNPRETHINAIDSVYINDNGNTCDISLEQTQTLQTQVSPSTSQTQIIETQEIDKQIKSSIDQPHNEQVQAIEKSADKAVGNQDEDDDGILLIQDVDNTITQIEQEIQNEQENFVGSSTFLSSMKELDINGYVGKQVIASQDHLTSFVDKAIAARIEQDRIEKEKERKLLEQQMKEEEEKLQKELEEKENQKAGKKKVRKQVRQELRIAKAGEEKKQLRQQQERLEPSETLSDMDVDDETNNQDKYNDKNDIKNQDNYDEEDEMNNQDDYNEEDEMKVQDKYNQEDEMNSQDDQNEENETNSQDKVDGTNSQDIYNEEGETKSQDNVEGTNSQDIYNEEDETYSQDEGNEENKDDEEIQIDVNSTKEDNQEAALEQQGDIVGMQLIQQPQQVLFQACYLAPQISDIGQKEGLVSLNIVQQRSLPPLPLLTGSPQQQFPTKIQSNEQEDPPIFYGFTQGMEDPKHTEQDDAILLLGLEKTRTLLANQIGCKRKQLHEKYESINIDDDNYNDGDYYNENYSPSGESQFYEEIRAEREYVQVNSKRQRLRNLTSFMQQRYNWKQPQKKQIKIQQKEKEQDTLPQSINIQQKEVVDFTESDQKERSDKQVLIDNDNQQLIVQNVNNMKDVEFKDSTINVQQDVYELEEDIDQDEVIASDETVESEEPSLSAQETSEDETQEQNLSQPNEQSKIPIIQTYNNNIINDIDSRKLEQIRTEDVHRSLQDKSLDQILTEDLREQGQLMIQHEGINELKRVLYELDKSFNCRPREKWIKFGRRWMLTRNLNLRAKYKQPRKKIAGRSSTRPQFQLINNQKALLSLDNQQPQKQIQSELKVNESMSIDGNQVTQSKLDQKCKEKYSKADMQVDGLKSVDKIQKRSFSHGYKVRRLRWVKLGRQWRVGIC
eukprot:TRINITY_DN3278_c0_g1_i1.p1 TRINITY_DN3278_c0_g1~~TRINITY_DN3278_c0_g1_i1.p1  ORF type:complete len:1139 (-),score=223.67 TRINITY_DN3278_c0_g1_i1:196-3612(-)